MSPLDVAPLRVHEDRVRFLEAVNVTAATTGFAPRLVEKDYFCTVLLHSLTSPRNSLIFKGGTCLAKVHAGFYRLSEDLDFTIPTPTAASRLQRSRRARFLRPLLTQLGEALTGVRIVSPLEGSNSSAH